MRILSERAATPSEIAAAIDEPVNNVAYHIKVLRRLDCIELVKTRQTRGGRVAEHLYRATQRPFWDAAAWEQLDDAAKLNVTGAIMHQISVDIANAMSHGTFNSTDENHISRSPMIVDDEGWQEVVSLLERTVEDLMEIQNSVNRRDADRAELRNTHVEIIQFLSPRPKTGGGETNL